MLKPTLKVTHNAIKVAVAASLLVLFIVVTLCLAFLNKGPAVFFDSDETATSATLFPEDFPVYPKAEIIRMETDPPKKFSVGFASTSSPNTVFQYYLVSARQKGWQITEQKNLDLIFRAIKDNIEVTLSVSKKAGEKTAILEQIIFLGSS